nr:hypothetical protein [Clostridia bacterium]
MSILGLRAMIEERNVKVERVARAKYALFEHDNIEEIDKFDNVDEYVLNEMKKDKELNDLKYQYKMISIFMDELTKTNAYKLLSYIRLRYFFNMPRKDIIKQLNLTEKTYDIIDDFLLEKLYRTVINRGNIFRDWSDVDV